MTDLVADRVSIAATEEIHHKRVRRDAALVVCRNARAHGDLTRAEDARDLLDMLGLDPDEARTTKGALFEPMDSDDSVEVVREAAHATPTPRRAPRGVRSKHR